VAIAFAREGANVALAYLPAEQPDAVEIDKILDETGVKVLHLPGDLADVSYRNTLVHKTLGAFGGLDILVNNAGKQLSVEDIDELSDEQIEQTFAKGIRVNAVAPGPIWTPLQPSHGQPPEKLTSFGHDTWLGRAGQPAELAPTYVFLASNESSYILGETLNVNGGRATP
jgi:NAD(P)-dependent dehydrogenase (short-subunit alcohol dehydrogenase family)